MNTEKLMTLMKANNYMDVGTIILYLLITLVLCSIVFIIYKMTFTGVAYSNNFNFSIVLTGLITAMIMMVIGNNLALSLGMVGALSIVRFRAAIKEPKDISFLFWAIAIGLSAGTGAIQIAIVGTIFITLVIIIYHMMPTANHLYLVVIKGDDFSESEVKSLMKKHTKKYRLRVKNSKDNQKEMIFEVRMKKDEAKLTQELHEMDKITSVNAVVFDGHLNE